MDEYIELLIECIRLLPPDMVIHRISGDGPKIADRTGMEWK